MAANMYVHVLRSRKRQYEGILLSGLWESILCSLYNTYCKLQNISLNMPTSFFSLKLLCRITIVMMRMVMLMTRATHFQIMKSTLKSKD